MTDPVAILDAKGRELYEAWIASPAGRRARWNPFSGTDERREWDRLDNHTREVWRGKALLALRSKESVADELRREESVRKAQLKSAGVPARGEP